MEVTVKRPRGRPRKRRRPEEENENAVADAKFNNSKTKKQVLETRSVAFVGRYVLKEFGRRAFLGKIVSYDTGLYRVDYEDGDFEDLESGELWELILEESYFDVNLSRRKVRLDELVLSRIVKESKLEENKKLEVLKNEVNGVENSAVSKLSGEMVVENEGEQDKDDGDSSSDSCEHAHDRELSLESEIPLIPPPILPPSLGTIGVPEEYISHLFSVYGFLRSFSIILFLNPFRLDDFVGSLNCSEPNPLLDAVHVSLMRALSCHLETISSEGSEPASKCLRCLDWSLLDTLTWPAYLVQYFVIMGYAKGLEWKGFYEDVAEREYYSLPASKKLMILQILCDDVLDYAELKAEIDMREATEVGVDPDATVTNPLEKGPRRAHPIYSKTSAFKGREVMELTSESHEVKSSSRICSLGMRSTGGTADVDTDVDGNSDECCLCGMDGTLLCCDGCPSAYHSRCIGVMKMHIPEGPWYCPECVIDKMGPAIAVNSSLRGAELFGVDLYGQVFLGTCNHLLVFKPSLDTESYVRYYNLNDIPKVLQVLSSSIEHKTLYFDICKAIIHYWNVSENIVSPLGIGGNVVNSKEDAKFSTGSPLPVVKDSHKFLGSVDVDYASSFSGSNVGVLCPDPFMLAMNQTDLPLSLSNGGTMGGKDHSPMNKKLPEQIYSESAISAASFSQQTASDVTHQSLVDRSSVIDHASCASGNSSNSYGGAANGIYFQANMFCQSQSKVGEQIGFGRDARNSAVDYLYMGISFKPQAYVNHYNHGHFAATAAAKLAVLSSEESQVSEVNKSGSARKFTSASNILLQVKAFSLAASRFFWPSAEKKLLDIPRERCGWCHSCKFPGSSKRGCMLNSAVSTATKSTNKILSGLPSLKNGEGSLPSIATYILYMEETLRGLVAGSFLNADYRKLWRRKVEEASTCRAIKALLFDLEENISVSALSADWVKLDDWLVDPCVIQSTSSAVGLPHKHGPGGRRRRKQSVAYEVTADDSDDKSFEWWRGGKFSTHVFQKAILPASMVRKTAQQGGVRKISGINYVDDFEIPKRSRQLIWRAAVERSKNLAQLALQVRYLDLHVRWNDLVRPDHNISDGKGSETEVSVFRNAIICDKKSVGSKIQYGVAFGNQKHLPSRVMKNIIDIEQTEDKKEKYWFHLTYIPLYLIKEYEERMSVAVLSSVKKPFTELSELQRRQLKASRRNIFAYMISKRDKSEKCSCTSCQMDVFLRNAVKCGTCLGYCHQDCTLSSMHMNGKVECLTICKGCYHAKVLAQNEINTKSSTNLLLLQGRDCRSAPAATKGMQVKSSTQPMKPLASIRSKENLVRIQEKSYDTKQSALNNGSGVKRSKLCNWGIIWRKKNSETGIEFRQAHILTKGVLDNHLLKPTCELCEQPYNSNLMYIHCETCGKWYHADAVELDESRVSDVVGFKCCKCRRIKGPECPFMDPELIREQKRKKRSGKLQKQGQGSLALDSDLGTISDSKEWNPVTPITSAEDELVYANDPQLFSLSKVEQITEDISEVDVELNTPATGPQKLPVRRQIKREGEVDGVTEVGLEHVELSTYPEPDDFAGPKGESSIPFAQWHVSGNGGFEGEPLFDYGNLSYEDMDFEPQTYFSFTELLASDDGMGDGLKDLDNQVDPMNPDVTALHCHVCLQNDPAPELYCDICGFLMHTQCSPWDESTSSESSWRCGRCREWR
ncbi:DDT-PHD PROTEIN2 [Hibiscus trionum]|uniref:DDT-PHD PROTEIN2 n=1 Tax=Hibiscus trionum TaxID=183268 RepID=A0A9W7MQB4_HIBTR|nr:DDT-PHD PROTEIN2 [Hibiscus trionum]